MKDDKSLTRRQFLLRTTALGVAIPLTSCLGEWGLDLEEPCSSDRSTEAGLRVQCPDGVEGVVHDQSLCITDGDSEQCYDEVLRFGYGTDLHYADLSTENDAYRRGDDKLTDAIEAWNDADVEFVVMAGDYIDGDLGAPRDDVLADLEYLEEIFDTVDAPRHYAMGNHDLDVLTKDEFVSHSAMDELYYSFDAGGFHFVVVDPNYTSADDDAGYGRGDFSHLDIWLNPAQLQWLEDDLSNTDLPSIVISHQRLARNSGDFANNAEEVRAIFADTDRVVAVFAAHAHENENVVVDGIHYFCMDAMVTGSYPQNAYAVVHLYEENYVYIEGFGSQASYLRRLAPRALPGV